LGIANPENYLEIAASEVRAAQALRDDLMAVLFPHGAALPSELLQTRVKQKLQALVNGIESELEGAAQRGQSWDKLAQSGLLRETALIDFALARVAEDRLQKSLAAAADMSPLAQLPVKLFDHENEQIAEMAKLLLNAEQQVKRDQDLFRRLDPELLHLLCWRVVAVLQEAEGAEDSKRHARAATLLSAHDSDDDPALIARKLVFFLGLELRSSLLDPRKAGLQLFVATLAQEFSLPSDLLFRLIGGTSAAPLLLLLKAANIPVAQLPSILIALRGFDGMEQSQQVADIYGTLDPVDARVQITAWTDKGLAEA
jgi:hypothetical protein